MHAGATSIPATWPPLPALVLEPHATWRTSSTDMPAADVDTIERAVATALDEVATAITITRSTDEVRNLLRGAPRLRTIHDRPPGLPVQIEIQRAMRVHMESAKGTFDGGATAYGALLVRTPDVPAPVLDLFGGVALTLRESARRRATFLPTDSMMTPQRPAASSQLASVLTERLLRDAGLVDAPEMNDERLDPARRAALAADLRSITVTDAATGAALAAKLLHAPDFGTGMRYIEAQVPAVTLADVARIDVSARLPIAEQRELLSLAAAAGTSAAVA